MTQEKNAGTEQSVPSLAYEEAAREIWEELKVVDCSEHVEKKPSKHGELSYLSWAWAYQMVADRFPCIKYRLDPVVFYAGGSAEVSCTVTIRHKGQNVSKYMWLPVMIQPKGSQIIADTSPDSMSINTAKMRCFTKCLSMFGLGAYIYAGEDLPVESDTPPPPHVMPIMPDTIVQPTQLPAQAPGGTGGPINYPTGETSDAAAMTYGPHGQYPVMPSTERQLFETHPTAAKDLPQQPTIADEPAATELVQTMITIARKMHASSVRELSEFWIKNKQVIDVLDNQYPNQYAALKEAFTELKQLITKQSQETAQ